MSRVTKTTLSLAVVVLSCSLIAGCHSQRWDEKSQYRVEKIDRGVHRYAKYDADGVERMDRTLNIAERSHERHDDHFHRTTALAERELESDVTRWYEETPKRRKFIRGQWETRPQTIPRTWAKMMY